MKAAYVRAPFQFQVQDVPLRPMGRGHRGIHRDRVRSPGDRELRR